MNIGTKMIGEMNITDIFRDRVLIKDVIIKCFSGALASDVQGYFGIVFEQELMERFNSINDDYKLLTVKATEELTNTFQFSFQPFCDDFQDLSSKTKDTFDPMSKADFLLFKKEATTLRLIDWSSCKTGKKKSGKQLILHNDPEGLIHDLLIDPAGDINQLLREDSNSTINIGKVHIVLYDDVGFSCYKFDGDFDKLVSQIDFTSSRIGKFTCEYKFNGVVGKMTTQNRNEHKSGSKNSSFYRGIKLGLNVITKSPIFSHLGDGTIEKDEINTAFIARVNP
jgi:hypothetical protein